MPNLLIEDRMCNSQLLLVGPWGGVNTNQNGVYMECFMDEVAKAAGKNPLEFRRALMKDFPGSISPCSMPRPRRVIGASRCWQACIAASHSSWAMAADPAAALAKVSVSPQGKLKVHRMVLALNSGHAVNPGQIEAQVQGSVAFGPTATLYGEMPVENGRMTNLNFEH